jgi:NAD(P)-dependent dehydrogenase (short-subunit alcohol dehydrogenase family)
MESLPMLAGKRLVIIGGTTGLGRSAARAFLRADAQIIAVGLDQDSCRACEQEYGPKQVLCADAVSPDTAGRAIALCAEQLGGFDGLYHVAGGSARRQGDGPLHELSDEGWRMSLELNLTTVMYSNRAAIRQFLAQKKGGVILNLGSVLSEFPAPRFFATHGYAAAKAAIVGLSRALAAYYAASRIRINVLAPGCTATPMSQRAVNDPDIVDYLRTKQPLDGGRIGQPADLDAAAVYLMSDSAGFVTGQVLAVDGGWSVSEGQVHP